MKTIHSGKKYIVTLAKSLGGKVCLVSWREPHGKTKYVNTSRPPYHLASFIMLMPKDPYWTDFTNDLYDFSHEDLDNLKPDDTISRVTRKYYYAKVSLQLP